MNLRESLENAPTFVLHKEQSATVFYRSQIQKAFTTCDSVKLSSSLLREDTRVLAGCLGPSTTQLGARLLVCISNVFSYPVPFLPVGTSGL
jgi:hypothetical protein